MKERKKKGISEDEFKKNNKFCTELAKDTNREWFKDHESERVKGNRQKVWGIETNESGESKKVLMPSPLSVVTRWYSRHLTTPVLSDHHVCRALGGPFARHSSITGFRRLYDVGLNAINTGVGQTPTHDWPTARGVLFSSRSDEAHGTPVQFRRS